jgi:hypothetical protein
VIPTEHELALCTFSTTLAVLRRISFVTATLIRYVKSADSKLPGVTVRVELILSDESNRNGHKLLAFAPPSIWQLHRKRRRISLNRAVGLRSAS